MADDQQSPTVIDRISNLWSTNKLLFFILLPVIIIAVLVLVFRDLILAYLIGSARKETEQAKKQDDQFKSQAAEQERQAAELKGQADADQKRIDERKESDISDDWFKNKK